MSGSYDVVTAALTNHARALSGLAAELRGGSDAAGGVRMTADAYGQIGQRIAATLDTLSRVGHETLLSGVEALESEAANLRYAVADYEHQETTGAARLGRAR
ncbi:MAG TPA: type VII secretion target [Actinophytocola sp.]|uniref:type VII secretion target n=1 Tax=Actinophytocola sp. TaxID=1872138 RepID=UPI002DDCEFFE|nr:type VII secretion target [Actinophytocola sp.]HEV2778857.1 type VII secretion target [Actinophytocola sp.]